MDDGVQVGIITTIYNLSHSATSSDGLERNDFNITQGELAGLYSHLKFMGISVAETQGFTEGPNKECLLACWWAVEIPEGQTASAVYSTY